MAPRPPDPELLTAIRAHLAARHDRAIDEAEIAPDRKGRLAAATLVTHTPETPDQPAWFTCHLCPKGAQRYRLDLFATPERPPARHLAAIRAHFEEAHDTPQLPEERIYHGPASAEEALCVYAPATPRGGASFICARCPQGMNRILIEEPAYGDARRLAWLLGAHPAFHDQIAGLDDPEARAIRLEAIDRGLVAAATQGPSKRPCDAPEADPPGPRASPTRSRRPLAPSSSPRWPGAPARPRRFAPSAR